MIYTLNLLASIASAGFGVIAIINPSVLSRSSQVTNGERFYQRMYSARAVTWELLTGILPFYHVRGPAVAAVLATSATVQLADVAIGLGRRDAGMAMGAFLAASVHAVCYWYTL